MGCLKCGRETIGEQSFCQDCQLQMARYPVRPGTVVQLPIRRDASPAMRKAAKKKTVPLEDQVRILKVRVRNLFLALLAALALAAATVFPAVEHMMENHFKVGQNYTAVTPSEAGGAGSAGSVR